MLKIKPLSVMTLGLSLLLFSCVRSTGLPAGNLAGEYTLTSGVPSQNGNGSSPIIFDGDEIIRITVVTVHPQILYGEDFGAFESKTEGQWYCFWLENWSSNTLDLRSPHINQNAWVFFLYSAPGSLGTEIDDISFAFEESHGLITLHLTLLDYSLFFNR